MSTNTVQISKVTGLLLMLFAISVLISQSLMDFFSTVLCLYLAYQWIRAKRAGNKLVVTPRMGFDWLWVVWFAVAAIGFAINTPPPAETPPHFWVDRLVEYKWIFILYFMVGALHIASWGEKSMNWFLGAVSLCSLYGITDYFIESAKDPEFRLGGIFQFSMTYAHVYGVFLCALFGLALYVLPKITLPRRFSYVATLTILGISVLLTFTRGIWIGAFGAIIGACFLHRFRTGLIAVIAGGLLAMALYTLVPSIKGRVDFTARVAEAKTAKESYDTERVVLWKTNLMIFKDHPLFGAGYGQNKFLLHSYYEKQGLPKDQFIGHAHNQYLHLLAGTGLLGLLCYLGILGTIAVFTLLAFIKIPQEQFFHKGLALGSLAGQACFAIGGLTESNFEHSKVRFAIMFMWALGIWLWQLYKKPSRTLQNH